MSLKKSQCQPPKANIRKIAITGGIGSGKSYVCRSIEAAGYPIFYCDDEAKRIIRSDRKVQQALSKLVGKGVYNEQGQLVKPVLAAYLCRGKAYAAQVDAIVHPRVGECFLEWCEQQTTDKVFMECALLFESGFNRYVDFTIHVAAPQEVRLNRVMARDSVSQAKALEWMALQLPEEEKAKRADYIINNDGNTEIEPQIRQILED